MRHISGFTFPMIGVWSSSCDDGSVAGAPSVELIATAIKGRLSAKAALRKRSQR